jgi:hypothetical protein
VTHVPDRDPAAAVEEPVAAFKDLCADAGDALALGRFHLDIRLPAPDPAPLVAAGARLVSSPDGETPWWVLADPEGNEFCAFGPGR